MRRSMTVCGIDPGLQGGITILSDERSGKVVVNSFPMPILDIGKKHILDPKGIATILRGYPIDKVAIEQVGAMPGQGVTSMFSFGYGAGMLEGIVACLGIPYELVRPQRWMKDVLSGLPKDAGAKSSIVWCQRKFPEIDWRRTVQCKKPSDGKTDSCCIAWYAMLDHPQYGLYKNT